MRQDLCNFRMSSSKLTAGRKTNIITLEPRMGERQRDTRATSASERNMLKMGHPSARKRGANWLPFRKVCSSSRPQLSLLILQSLISSRSSSWGLIPRSPVEREREKGQVPMWFTKSQIVTKVTQTY